MLCLLAMNALSEVIVTNYLSVIMKWIIRIKIRTTPYVGFVLFCFFFSLWRYRTVLPDGQLGTRKAVGCGKALFLIVEIPKCLWCISQPKQSALTQVDKLLSQAEGWLVFVTRG